MNGDVIQPIRDRVLVKAHECGEERTESGLYLPETAQGVLGRFKRGTVVRVGDEVKGLPLGSEVVYRQHIEQADSVGDGYLLTSVENLEATIE